MNYDNMAERVTAKYPDSSSWRNAETDTREGKES
jgi:hypothetical protein